MVGLALIPHLGFCRVPAGRSTKTNNRTACELNVELVAHL